MFDNPKKDLEWLNQQLQAAEDEESAPAPPKNQAPPKPTAELTKLYDFDAEDEEPEKPKKSGTAGLVVAMILETMGLVALIAWWLLWRR